MTAILCYAVSLGKVSLNVTFLFLFWLLLVLLNSCVLSALYPPFKVLLALGTGEALDKYRTTCHTVSVLAWPKRHTVFLYVNYVPIVGNQKYYRFLKNHFS